MSKPQPPAAGWFWYIRLQVSKILLKTGILIVLGLLGFIVNAGIYRHSIHVIDYQYRIGGTGPVFSGGSIEYVLCSADNAPDSYKTIYSSGQPFHSKTSRNGLISCGGTYPHPPPVVITDFINTWQLYANWAFWIAVIPSIFYFAKRLYAHHRH